MGTNKDAEIDLSHYFLIFTVATHRKSHESVIYTADNLIEFYNTTYNLYGVAMLGVVALFVAVYRNIDSRVKLGEYVKHSNVVLPLLFASSSAMIGTQSVVQAKCMSILLRGE